MTIETYHTTTLHDNLGVARATVASGYERDKESGQPVVFLSICFHV